LHDGLQQLLVAAKFRLGAMERSKDQGMREVARELDDLLTESIESSRSLTSELSPPILHQGGLVMGLEWLVRWTQEKHGLTVNMTARSDLAPAGEEMTALLFQATRELLFNIVKHARVRTARLDVAQQDGALRIVVADKGVGFDPQRIRIAGGNAGGFGLFSLHERLELLGGRVEIDSAPGRGSRFVLCAPVLPAAPDVSVPNTKDEAVVSIRVSREKPASAEPGPPRIRIVLVDDHVVMRQGVAELLRVEPDLEVIGEASDGEAAIALVHDLRPDVVLMDINMRGMNGIDATKILHAELPDVQVIGLSMFEQEERAAAMRKAGAVAYFVKSGAPSSLIARIRTCATAATCNPRPAEPEPEAKAERRGRRRARAARGTPSR